MEILQANQIYNEMHTLCCYKLRILLGFDEVTDLSTKIIELPIDETRDFVRGYINADKSKHKLVNSFINELLSLKRKYNNLIEQDKAKQRVVEAVPIQEGFTVYKKEKDNQYAPKSKKKKQQRDKKQEKKQRQLENQEVKFVRKYCECQALVHPLINNCLKCGKIICASEGEGPCMFCGAAAGNIQDTEAIRKARAHRDKLIRYDNDSRVTKVYDDQADHFDYHGNQWLSEKQKQLMQKRQDDNDAKIREDQRKIVVTLDLAGRQIIEGATPQGNTTEDDETNDGDDGNKTSNVSSLSFANATPSGDFDEDDEASMDPFIIAEKEKKAGAFKNPFLQSQRPSFRSSNRKRPDDFLKTEGIKQKSRNSRISKTISCVDK